MYLVRRLRKDGGVDMFVVRQNSNVPLTDGRPLPPALSWMTRCTDLTKAVPDWMIKPSKQD